mmetsp:Transcript_9220/g.25921  ORF Transcript_9220/g.25921 Transcript_9220/m.25921 type:complete len:265 (+) Transcript_9220:79-873(+)
MRRTSRATSRWVWRPTWRPKTFGSNIFPRTESSAAMPRITFGRWERLVPVALALKSTTIASATATHQPWLMRTIRMLSKSGTLSSSSTTETTPAFQLCPTNTLIPAWDWSAWYPSFKTSPPTTTLISSSPSSVRLRSTPKLDRTLAWSLRRTPPLRTRPIAPLPIMFVLCLLPLLTAPSRTMRVGVTSSDAFCAVPPDMANKFSTASRASLPSLCQSLLIPSAKPTPSSRSSRIPSWKSLLRKRRPLRPCWIGVSNISPKWKTS